MLYLPNPHLKPETANNWTGGIVWSPKFVKGLTVSVDYYRIDIDNWIGQSTQFIIDENLRTGGPTNPASLFYTNVAASFDPATGLYDNAPISVPAFNLHNIFTDGIDIEANYIYPTEAFGSFTFKVQGNYILTYEQQTGPASPKRDRLGDFSADEIGFESIPRLKGSASLFWDYKLFDHMFEIGATANYISGMIDDHLATGAATHRIPSFLSFDLQSSYFLPYDVKLTVGVLNVTDEPPPRIEAAFADKYDRDLYDLRQRFWYVSVEKKF